MKKLFPIIALLATSLIAIPSNAAHQITVSATTPTTQVVSADNWSFTLPSGDWAKLNAPNGIQVALFNRDKHAMVMLIKETFAGDNKQYVLAALKSLKDDGATFKSIKQVAINGTNYTVVETVKDTTKAWFWIMTKDGFGYGLSCGGLTSDEAQNRVMCFGVAETLTIK